MMHGQKNIKLCRSNFNINLYYLFVHLVSTFYLNISLRGFKHYSNMKYKGLDCKTPIIINL
jgi:hypothetical protein